MPAFDREKTIAVGVLALVLLAAILIPALCLKTRADAAEDLAEQQDMLARLEAAHQHIAKKGAAGAMASAPATAFLSAQTPGLASAQLETYLSQLAVAQHASLISSGAAQANKADPAEIVRIQATLDMSYDALQPLLYQLESGTPYVFVDSMTLQTATQQTGHADMKVILSLHALWHRDPV